jgi:N-acetyl-1-D-myo-inositol-2-amino-2-deoxy-alpha-D-glucopyranoside deacetylase
MSPREHDKRILLVHAHPDDESIGTGATMAKYAADGAYVCLVTCTLGEEGEVIPPKLAHLAAGRDNRLGEYRIGELAEACAALGVKDHRFLGGAGHYRDSGMMGAPSNEDPDCFWQASVSQAAGKLVQIVREIRPQVIVTYDDNGAYGHPDHIQAHRVAWRAFEMAGFVDRFYATAFPLSVLEKSIKQPGGPFEGVEKIEDLGFGTPDDQVTTEIDGRAHLAAKLAALRAHRTQIAVDAPFFALSNNISQEAFGTEYYTLVAGERAPLGPDGRETDLFAGLG